MIGKQIQLKYEWKWVELTDKELNRVLDKLLDSNIRELERVINRVVGRGGVIRDMEFSDVVKMLFDKQATASFTVINNALDKKIFMLRQRAYKKIDNEWVKKKVEEGFKQPERKPEKSLIDKAFESESNENTDNR